MSRFRGGRGAVVLAALIVGVATSAVAQPKVFSACYVPSSGTVYRVNEPDVKPACVSPVHVAFSWTDGANALHVGDAILPTLASSTALGAFSTASGSGSVALGTGNTASGDQGFAVGTFNTASGTGSTALGTNVTTDGMQGAFAYADQSSPFAFHSVAANEFAVRAGGGIRFRTAGDLSTGCDLPSGSGTFSCTSSRFAKTHFRSLRGDDVLRKIARMPIESWEYRTDSTAARHVGPTAQDFRAAFGLGTDDTSISLVDIDGINLLGVQTLARRMVTRDRQNADLRARLARSERDNAALHARIEKIERALERSGLKVTP